jgi:hypothetical protein
MPQLCKSVVDALGKPEWIAAGALLIQAVILIVQSKILGRHAETMEKHTEIAGTQAKTAELVGKALEQQGKILGDQTKIMEEQFKFQRRLEEKAERVRIVDQLTELFIAVKSFSAMLDRVSEYTQEVGAKVTEKESLVTQSALGCIKELQSSIHITTAERQYFMEYVLAVNGVPTSTASTFRECTAGLKALETKYKDVLSKLSAAAHTPL